jgi:hypothetical protein
LNSLAADSGVPNDRLPDGDPELCGGVASSTPHLLFSSDALGAKLVKLRV